jgi:hypothetical protein
MALLTPDAPFGQPAFALSVDQIATVLDLVCRGAQEAQPDIKSGMLEVPTTIVIRKAMRRVKKDLELTNLEIRGEHELENMATTDATILGRIDITLKFLHQFGNEDAYVAIECKRVGASLSDLNAKYVSNGVDRFVTGQYGSEHEWGFMLGYVLALPVQDVVGAIDKRLQKVYGATAKLTPEAAHTLSLAIFEGALTQNSGHAMRLKHVFVDMTAAADA